MSSAAAPTQLPAASPVLSPDPAAKVSVPDAAMTKDEMARWRPVLDLACELSVDLPLPRFRVSDFLALRVGSVVGTQWRLTHDVPLRVNGVLIGWGEFEGSGLRLAVRLTELA